MKLKTVGVIGAGTSGRGIIRSLAGSGLDVVFCEVSDEQVERSLRELEQNLDYEILRWVVTESEKRLILSRVTGTTDFRNLSSAEVVIESIPGDLEDKQALFQEMDGIFSTDTVLVSNASTISISEIARHASHPERIVGMHFTLPVPRRPIVEVVRGRQTSERTLTVVRQLAKIMKKEIFEVFEMPGLITMRVMIPYINEAMHIVMEGVANAEQVDKAIRLGFKLPSGPLTKADQIGLDSLLRDMERLFKSTGDARYRPCPLLRRMVREGHLGVKTGQGFFLYDNEGKGVGLPRGAY